jgi:hypothetical protein
MAGPATANFVTNLWRSGIFWTIVLVLMWSCSDGEPPSSVSEAPGRNLRLVFEWPGDDPASQQDLAIRDKIGRQLVTQQVGKIVRSGTGMGWMDIVLEVNDPERALPEVEAVVKAIAPDIKFAIQVGKH